MIRLITVAGFALLVAPSAQGMTPAPIPRPDGMITQVAYGCGLAMIRVNGVCVARSTLRQARRAYYGTGAYYGGYTAGYPASYYGAYTAGYPGGYYGGYSNYSYVTGRPTVFPRYYGAYAAAYPAGYYGGYANRSYVTGRPTLLPRYYNAGWGWGWGR
jgi:hypothetical protein